MQESALGATVAFGTRLPVAHQQTDVEEGPAQEVDLRRVEEHHSEVGCGCVEVETDFAGMAVARQN